MKKILPVILICFVCFGVGNAWTILPAISNLVIATANSSISYREYGSLSSLLVICAFIASYLSSHISRFKGTKLALIIGIACVSLSMSFLTYAFFSTHRLLWISVSQGFLGLGIGAILTSFSAYLSLYMPHKTALTLTSTYACVNLGSFSSPLFFQAFNTLSRWWVNASAIAGFFFVLMLLVIYGLPKTHNTSPVATEKTSKIIASLPKYYFLFIINIVVYAITEIAFSSWLPIYLHHTKDFSLTLSNQSLSVFWISVGISQATAAFLLLKPTAKLIYSILPLFLFISFAGLILLHGENFLLASIIIGAMGCSAFFSLTMNLATKQFHHVAEFISGNITGGYFLGSALGTFCIGWLKDDLNMSLPEIFLIMCALTIIIQLMSLTILKKAK